LRSTAFVAAAAALRLLPAATSGVPMLRRSNASLAWLNAGSQARREAIGTGRFCDRGTFSHRRFLSKIAFRIFRRCVSEGVQPRTYFER
jgi:hypothetical protein